MKIIFNKRNIVQIISILVIIMSSLAVGLFVGASLIIEIKNKRENYWKRMSETHFAIMEVLKQWLVLKQQGKEISDYLYENNIKNIAIYGMGHLGENLYSELKNRGIKVKYAIDRKLMYFNEDLKVVSPDAELEPVDAIVVTPVFYYDEIKRVLSHKINAHILSLEDILGEL